MKRTYEICEQLQEIAYENRTREQKLVREIHIELNNAIRMYNDTPIWKIKKRKQYNNEIERLEKKLAYHMGVVEIYHDEIIDLYNEKIKIFEETKL